MSETQGFILYKVIEEHKNCRTFLIGASSAEEAQALIEADESNGCELEDDYYESEPIYEVYQYIPS